MDKRTFVGGGQFRKSSLNPCKIRKVMKNNFFSNIIFKDVKEFNIIFLILISLFLVGISGYSSYAIFSDEIVSNNEIKGIVKVKNLDKSGANKPLLTSNMIPVYYDESDNNWKKADSSNGDENYKWYDYDSKMWANAVTVSSANRTKYLSANKGTIIPMNDINAMFVWIPRYKYTYFSSSTPTEISIMFEKGIESTGTIKCTDAIVASSDKSEVCTDTTNGSLVVRTSTYTHPAFTFGNEELTGIWVGKFETSGDDASTIKPDAIPTQNMDISTFFKYSRNMELANNIYGFSQSGTTLTSITGEISGDSNNLDTHLIKNMEWGATAYLSHSKYGTCENGTCIEVGINNYYDGTDLLIGCGAAAGSDTSDVCNRYNTSEGMKASTTGNVYGIYDMSGGTYEYVMANMQDENNKFYPEYSGWSTTDVPLDKYYDKYSYDESGNGNEFSYGKLGDATIETQPDAYYLITWYDDYANFLFSSCNWFIRGGYSGDDVFAGVLGFGCDYGNADDIYGSRVVLSVSLS